MKQDNVLFNAPESGQDSGLSRRKFLSLAGIGMIGAAALASCSKNNPTLDGQDVDLGSGDIGIQIGRAHV